MISEFVSLEIRLLICTLSKFDKLIICNIQNKYPKVNDYGGIGFPKESDFPIMILTSVLLTKQMVLG